MGVFKRLIRYISINGFSSFSQLSYRILSWLYTFRFVRLVVRPFVKAREPKKWVFIVGCYNSGTTLLKDVLGSHLNIACLPREGVRFTKHLTAPEDLGWTRMWSQCIDYVSMSKGADGKTAGKIIRDWSPWWSEGKDVFLEKSISNVVRMEWLDTNFDNSYFIGITRNPYCSIEGMKRKAKPSKKVSKLVGEVYPVEMTAEQCDMSLNILENNSDKVRRYFSITYEDLVLNPMLEIKKICEFLQLDSPEMSFYDGVLIVNKKEFRLKNMNGRSINALSENDFRVINDICSNNIETLGYKPIN